MAVEMRIGIADPGQQHQQPQDLRAYPSDSIGSGVRGRE
jgi:hypothetical protein